DVVLKIGGVETNSADKPLEEVKIKSSRVIETAK
ncbi:MAG TPA: peptidylprolyl isomerase, partial [Planctomycetaceae bacterium]|nr:peptidylprolyl isomerase [Planctomycetaceae bacterium]